MIDRQQAEQLAAIWARRDSQRLGHECTPMVDEFDLGYVITSVVPTEARTVPGDLPTTVIDKQTGKVTTWPRVPSDVVADMYRRNQPSGPAAARTVDQSSLLVREIHRIATPNTTAHLTIDGRIWTAQGTKGAVPLNHHPLVRTYLDRLPPGELVRGGEGHAELIVVSDVLHEYDHLRAAEGIAPMGRAEAAALLEGARFEIFRVREPGDPAGGAAERPCDSCVDFLVRANVLPESARAYTETWLPPAEPDPDPGRFPPEVANALVAAGWRPHIGDQIMAAAAVRDVTAVVGRAHRHEVFPAAVEALTAFPSLVGARRGPGEQVWISRFDIRPHTIAHTADTLADFGAVLGVRLFPIGTEQQDSILAVDERGRVFALDQAGEWFLGDTIDAALTTLLLGRAPARVRDDGTWQADQS
ncbi:SUKH-3 domain-containing protein [Micromonospora sp. STR1_7]|uniref:SUKH-3 domain-containing protein n=1 Tax=Micromonospora parastrephiae TaxID=2806101 RepID=A0ABS1Y2D5_9ACTN|nr:SUKH-3 domain-containing protein [Micromonospora parastrephiae]MBM0235645.1 SUKH-3 domain-containing protein [Micromonospora parastrephiae]